MSESTFPETVDTGIYVWQPNPTDGSTVCASCQGDFPVHAPDCMLANADMD